TREGCEIAEVRSPARSGSSRVGAGPRTGRQAPDGNSWLWPVLPRDVALRAASRPIHGGRPGAGRKAEAAGAAPGEEPGHKLSAQGGRERSDCGEVGAGRNGQGSSA